MGLQRAQDIGCEFSSFSSGSRSRRRSRRSSRRRFRRVPFFLGCRFPEVQPTNLPILSIHTDIANKWCMDAWRNYVLHHHHHQVAMISNHLNHGLKPFPDGLGSSFIPFLTRCAKPTEPVVVEPRNNMPSPRPMIWLPDSDQKLGITTKVSKVRNIKVLTYNILSHIYVNVSKYPHCPPWALAWEYRRENLLSEIIQYHADVLCLQEVQSDHYENFFKPELWNCGYSAVYKKKTKEVYTGNGYTIDGCAIFFRRDKFKKIKSYEIEYSKSASSLMEKLKPNLRDQAGVRLIKHNVALAVVLETEDIPAETTAASFTRFCVVNTHIYAGRRCSDVQLLQVSDLINEIEQAIDPKMPLFICGDMNSSPGSDPYNLLTKHEVDPACATAPDPLGIYEHLKLRHSMKLASAYASALSRPVNDNEGKRMIKIHPETGEPFFTNLTPSHTSTLDYIFYTEDSLEVEGLLKLPNKESMGKALPSPVWSSDHIALMASFRITRPFLGEPMP